MKWKMIFSALLCGFLVAGCATQNNVKNQVTKPVETVGVYDSRAVALAFMRSDAFDRVVVDMECRNCTNELADMRCMLLPQVHSTASVDNILGYIGAQVPSVLQTADVDMLASKWDEETLARYAAASRVDVTMLLVAQFNPSQALVSDVLETITFEPLTMEFVERLQ